MKQTNNPQINTGIYWDQMYDSPEKRSAYVMGQTGLESARFRTALDEIKDGDKVLDIGCGVGLFTAMVKGSYPNCEVWGTDISAKAIHDNTMENPQIKYLAEPVGGLTNVPDGYFDIVFSGEVLEHLDDPATLFKDVARVLRKGGTFILTTPLKNTIRTPEHMWEFTHEDVQKLYEDNGFRRPRFVYLPDMEHLLVIFAVGRK